MELFLLLRLTPYCYYRLEPKGETQAKISTPLSEKYPTLFFNGFQRSALAWGDLEPSNACVNFPRLSMASVDGKLHSSEVVSKSILLNIMIYAPMGRFQLELVCFTFIFYRRSIL